MTVEKEMMEYAITIIRNDVSGLLANEVPCSVIAATLVSVALQVAKIDGVSKAEFIRRTTATADQAYLRPIQ